MASQEKQRIKEKASTATLVEGKDVKVDIRIKKFLDSCFEGHPHKAEEYLKVNPYT